MSKDLQIKKDELSFKLEQIKKEVNLAKEEKRTLDTTKYLISNEIQQTVKINFMINETINESN